MCLRLCLNRKTYKVCHCLPLWFFFVVIALVQLSENLLFLVDPFIILPSLGISIVFIPIICCHKSLQVRNCIWIAYLIGSLTQLLVTTVALATVILFPGEEDCRQSKDKNGNVMFICTEIERDEETSLGDELVLIGLISYFLLKTSFLVYFLHAFARKIIWEEQA